MKNSKKDNNIEAVNEIDAVISGRRNKGKGILNAFVWVFLCIIFGVAVFNFIDKDEEYSEKENRVLASFPVISASTISEGSFMKAFETYMTDQFIFRDSLMSLKTLTDRVLGKKQINGVYIGSDGYLFAEPEAFDKKLISETANAISSFCDKHGNMKKAIMIAPDSGFIYSNRLPSFVTYPDQKQQLKSIKRLIDRDSLKWINLLADFNGRAEKTQLYYRTDHHWTTRGAFRAFKLLAKKWGLETADVKYKFYTVSTDFSGTLSSRTGIANSADTVEICVPVNSEGTYVVSYESLQNKTATLFDNTRLDSKNKYEVFLGGNFDKITVTTVSQSKSTLLLIKDSYANCLIPMLTPYFNKIVIIDPRYFTGSLDKIMEETDFTHMLFLYNLNTILADTSLASCLDS